MHISCEHLILSLVLFSPQCLCTLYVHLNAGEWGDLIASEYSTDCNNRNMEFGIANNCRVVLPQQL